MLVAKALLAEKLERLLDKATLEKLKSIPDTGGQVSLADLKAQGLNLRFDQGLMELVFEPSVDQRGTGEISLSGSGAQRTVESAASVLPAMFSGYLNVVAGVDQRWGPTASGDPASLRLELESVFRVWDLVIENEFLHEGQVDIARCPTAAQCLYDHTAGWKRRSSRATYDLAGENIRLQFGDTTPLTTTGQTSEDELGVSVEHSPRKLSPGETIRSSGPSSFLRRSATRHRPFDSTSFPTAIASTPPKRSSVRSR